MSNFRFLLCHFILVSFLQTVQTSWWYLGVLSSSPMTFDGQQLATEKKCSNLAFLDPHQRKLCDTEDKLLDVISRGASMGIDECQYQSGHGDGIVRLSTRPVCLEKKQGNSLHIRDIVCRRNVQCHESVCQRELDHCGCDVKVRSRETKGQFEWGGCSENTVKTEVDLLCKCHGVSGSCSVKICWRKMNSFRQMGAYLKQKFDGASLVAFNTKKTKLRRVSDDRKSQAKKDLVYLEESPDFCEKNPPKGSLGTRGRQCNKTSYGLDGCTLMCAAEGVLYYCQRNCGRL
ncbi:hypothetical protein ScPMuIL_017582 [Solemya velum]